MRGLSRVMGAALCALTLAACASDRKTVQLPSAAQATAPRPEPGKGEADRWRSMVDEFLGAVRTRDIAKLNRVRGRERTYDRTSLKDREFYAMLYDGNYIRTFHKGAHSVAEMLELGGGMHAHIIDYDVNKILIYFVPYNFIEDLGQPGFLKKQWLRKYFSCIFAWEAGTWMLADDCSANQISGRVARLNY
jgi:hypothetical protein